MIIIPTHQPDIPEAVLQKLVIAHVNTIPGVRVWRANTGQARTASGSRINFGVKGQADLTGILGPSGRRIEIECKRLRGAQSKDQKKWQVFIESMGGLYILAHTLAEAVVPVCQVLNLQYEVR